MLLPHTFTWAHEFDVDNMSLSDMRDLIARHADLTRFCEENVNCSYVIKNFFSKKGIICEFEDRSERDKLDQFVDDYWIHFHD